MSYDGSTFFVFCFKKSYSNLTTVSTSILASGILFSPFMALFVSTCGLAITLTIPYLIGYFSGKKVVQSIQEKVSKGTKNYGISKGKYFFCLFHYKNTVKVFCREILSVCILEPVIQDMIFI